MAIYPRDGDNVIDLIRNADAALYAAKKAGGNCFEYYSSDMNTEAVERLMLKSKLRRAFERDELRLHYQPKYRISTGRIEGVEALLRWDLPERGLVFPSDFVPLAEETNLILQLGDWVLNRVCADYRAWQRSVPSPCRVSLNLSLRQLQQRRFLDQVRDTFRAHGVSPTSLELEITETTLMEDPERTVRILDALYGMGLHLAIDDFGTGYSSLSALQQFPINTLKIDQSFVRDVAIDRDDAAIVDAIIQMAHSLRLEVVAEGVESEAQLEFLRQSRLRPRAGSLVRRPDDGRRILRAIARRIGRHRQVPRVVRNRPGLMRRARCDCGIVRQSLFELRRGNVMRLLTSGLVVAVASGYGFAAAACDNPAAVAIPDGKDVDDGSDAGRAGSGQSLSSRDERVPGVHRFRARSARRASAGRLQVADGRAAQRSRGRDGRRRRGIQRSDQGLPGRESGPCRATNC